MLKQEQGEIGSMLQSSFFADEDTSIKLQNIKQKKQIEPLFEKTKVVSCPYGCTTDDARKGFDLIDELWNVNGKLNPNTLPKAMQVVEVTTSKHLLKKMVVLKVEKNSCLCLF